MEMIRNKTEISENYFQGLPENEGLSKRTFLKIVAFASLGMVPFLNTCGIINSADTNQGPVKKPDTPIKNGSVPQVARPPIDLAAPKKIETATFALG
jgi:hypothetical protein